MDLGKGLGHLTYSTLVHHIVEYVCREIAWVRDELASTTPDPITDPLPEGELVAQ